MPFDQAMAEPSPDPTPPSGLSDPLDTPALAQLFLQARTHNGWLDRPVAQQTLRCLYELTRWGPTAANSTPARFRFLVSGEAKQRLSPHLSNSNRAKTLAAPATVIIGFDLDFPTTLEKLAPRSPNAASWFTDPVKSRESAFRSGSLQAGYFIIAARALGLDCGPISGFDSAGVDREFFAGTRIETNIICNLGYGDPAALRPRAPRLEFEEAAAIL